MEKMFIFLLWVITLTLNSSLLLATLILRYRRDRRTLQMSDGELAAIIRLCDRNISWIYQSIMADRGNAELFAGAFVNRHNRQLYPEHYRHGAQSWFINLNEFCALAYLETEESADIAFQRLTAVGDDYYPWLDINRYALKCFGGNEEAERCAVFKALRTMCDAKDMKLVTIQLNALVAYVDHDGIYGLPETTYVGNGDGRCGPVSAKMAYFERTAIKRLSQLCEGCPFAKTLDNGNGCTDKRNNGCEKSNRFHSKGIIAFLKRVFGKGERG